MKTDKIGIIVYYNYSVPNYDGTFIHRKSKAKIVDETNKSYQIELLEFTNTRKPKDIFWVSKRKVELPKENERYWWQDLFQ